MMNRSSRGTASRGEMRCALQRATPHLRSSLGYISESAIVRGVHGGSDPKHNTAEVHVIPSQRSTITNTRCVSVYIMAAAELLYQLYGLVAERVTPALTFPANQNGVQSCTDTDERRRRSQAHDGSSDRTPPPRSSHVSSPHVPQTQELLAEKHITADMFKASTPSTPISAWCVNCVCVSVCVYRSIITPPLRRRWGF
jgi:hypothetical protein